MPFIARNKKSGERVDITKIENPKQTLQKGDLVCQVCNEEMILVAGHIVRPHFRHKSECKSDYSWHPESIEHLLAKELISHRAKEEFQEYFDAEPVLEYPVKEVKRIIDVAFIFPMGWIVAHEIQLSRISVDELEQRTEDYLNAGIDVIWWLGKNADTNINREWSFNRFGHCFTIDYETLSSLSAEIERD